MRGTADNMDEQEHGIRSVELLEVPSTPDSWLPAASSTTSSAS
jgi:hypothetical protein